jgi:WXXGXW repeat (2 copies)
LVTYCFTHVVIVMNQRHWLRAAAACTFILILNMTACVVAPDQGHYYGGVVMVAPPEPRVEVVGVAPTPGYVWFNGYWQWIGGRHQWVAGHWAPGRAGYRWIGHSWVRSGDGWRMHPGHWERG